VKIKFQIREFFLLSRTVYRILIPLSVTGIHGKPVYVQETSLIPFRPVHWGVTMQPAQKRENRKSARKPARTGNGGTVMRDGSEGLSKQTLVPVSQFSAPQLSRQFIYFSILKRSFSL